MHDRAVMECSGDLTRKPPFPFHFELQRTARVAFDRSGTKTILQGADRCQGEPLTRAGYISSGGSEDLRLQGMCGPLADGGTKSLVGQQLPEVTGRRGIILPFSSAAVQSDRVHGTSHRYVEQTSLFLLVELFVVALDK